MELPEKLDSQNSQAGFTMVELIIVVVIMGILGAYVTYNLSSGSTKLKSYVFNTKTQFQRAKFEAVKRNRNVFIDFDWDGDGAVNNGYTILVDDDGTAGSSAGDTVIDTIVFQNGVKIYTSLHPEEPGASNNGPGLTKTIDDGVSAGGNDIIMRPNGRSENSTVYIYLPMNAADNTISAGPWAIITSTAGRIRVDEWTNSGWVTDT